MSSALMSVKVRVLAAVCALGILSVHTAAAQSHTPILVLQPAETPGDPIAPTAFRDACMNIGQWPFVRNHTQVLANADWSVDLMSDAEQATCFANMNSAGLTLGLGVGVLKPTPGCNTGSGCFNAARPRWDRMIGNGAHLGMFLLDEPLTAALTGLVSGYNYSSALNETRAFVNLIRSNYPGTTVVETEAYPAVNVGVLTNWITDLSCCGAGKIDYFEVDHDATPSYTDLRNLRGTAHAVGVGFAAILWAGPGANGSYNDYDWYSGVITHGYAYHNNYVNADLYDVTSWLHTPRNTVPEDSAFTFMYSVRNLIEVGLIPYPSLEPGQELHPGQSVESANTCFSLTYQGDGNLVLYRSDGFPMWASGTAGTSAGVTAMQGDGNFVVYDGGGTPVWNSGTPGHPGAYLIVQPDGNVVIYDNNYNPLWYTGTSSGCP
jgi:hypothetical protein